MEGNDTAVIGGIYNTGSMICVWDREGRAVYYGPEADANMVLVGQEAEKVRTDSDGTVHFREKEVGKSAREDG
jgi:hypothetical protein